MAHFEIEIKSLLGEASAAEALVLRMKAEDSECRVTDTNSQLNHYFILGDIKKLFAATKDFFSPEQQEKFQMIAQKGTSFSIRSRKKTSGDTTVVQLVIKAALDGGTSANTITRLEFEEKVSCSMAELDELLIEAGYTYEAKWSRDRTEYAYKDIAVCLDKNAGYGYVAEFETVTSDATHAAEARAVLEAHMATLGVTELSQDRLARMFAHYNAYWTEYYGTEKVFTIE